ncbi:hypothetical protein HHI36_010001 [Cryptolaemus montrouzieri]|uniref:Uncharacterized protein n=1 Tax=Cryptolaemus montrouzieri TaxID=559131 RepID=A0ABD2MHK3_9CUCU
MIKRESEGSYARSSGEVKKHEGKLRIRTNNEIVDKLNVEDNLKFIKSHTLLVWVLSEEDARMPRKILNAKIYATKKRGRPRFKLQDQELDYLRTMRATG